MHLTLIVPELLWPEPDDRQTFDALQAPGLAWLVARAELTQRARTPLETARCGAFPGAPGLAPPPAPTQPAPPPQGSHHATPPPRIPAACAKAKDVERCVERQELRRKARAVCKGKTGEAHQQCVNDYVNRRRK